MSDDKGSLINIGVIPKELITNLLGPATKSIGEGLGGITNFVMGPLRKLNVVSEKSYQDFVEKINSKTNDIPVENRDDSKLGLALKAMEDARYQLEDETMREYFSNLLAGLVDNRKNQNSSPRFSTMLSELTTEEATVLSKLFKLQAIPSVTLRIQESNASGVDAVSNLLILSEVEFLNSASTLETLQSYGLIEIRPSVEFTDETRTFLYNAFEKSDQCKNWKENILNQYKVEGIFHGSDLKAVVNRGSILVTNLGKIFCSMIFSGEEE